jgi:anti-anti-sigma regulatory factor
MLKVIFAPETMRPLSPGIYVASSAAAVYVRVIGRGACRNSVCLREYGLQKLQEGCRRLVIDLAQCDGLDSTFLGVFAGFGLALADSGQLALLNLAGENRRALSDLGLDQMAAVDSAPPETLRDELPPESQFQFLPGSNLTVTDRNFNLTERAVVMLESHEDLCRINDRNEEKFRAVKQYLREDIARHGPGELPGQRPPK